MSCSSFLLTMVLMEVPFFLLCPVLSLKVRKNATDVCNLTEGDLSNAEAVVEALEPMLVATKSMCEEKSATVSIIAPLLTQLLSDTASSGVDPPVVRGLKNAIHGDLAKRYTSARDKSFLHVASALDPRFKDMPFLPPREVEETYAMVVSKAAAIMVITTVATLNSRSFKLYCAIKPTTVGYTFNTIFEN